jgi:hypothetical protein
VRGVKYWGQIEEYSNIKINCDLTPDCVDVTKKSAQIYLENMSVYFAQLELSIYI